VVVEIDESNLSMVPRTVKLAGGGVKTKCLERETSAWC
jgi:hypothetical protein